MRNKNGLMLAAVCLGLSFGTAQAADTQIQASDSGKVTVQGDVVNADGNVTLTKNYGLNEEKLNALLEQREDRFIKKLLAASDDEQEIHLLKKQLKAVQLQKKDIQKTLEEEIQQRRATEETLKQLNELTPSPRIDNAIANLRQGYLEPAEETLEAATTPLAAYQSGQLAESRLDYRKALHQYRKAVELDPKNPDYLLAAGEMARTVADYDQAITWLKLLIDIRKYEKGDGVKLAFAQHALASIYQDIGNYKEAETLLQKALATEEAILGENNDVAATLSNQALLYTEQGKYEEAEPLYQHALTILENYLGKYHPDVGMVLMNLAQLYQVQGRYVKAEPLAERAVTIMEEALGKDHPKVASTAHTLALVYKSEGRYEEAQQLYQRSLEIREATMGKDHPIIANSLNNICALHAAQNKFAEAAPACQRALAIREKALEADHPDIANSMNNLAGIYYQQKKYREGKLLYQRALSILKKKFPNGHPDINLYQANYDELKRKMAEQ